MAYSSFLSLQPLQMLVALVDYSWVIAIYVSVGFAMALLIDGYILPPFDEEAARKTSTWLLAVKVLGQLAVQGFIVILICSAMSVPSPVSGILGYETHSSVGKIIRGAGIISSMLMELSNSLRERLTLLFNRLSPHTREET